ncbi:PGRS family protein [Sorangium sp. So ce1078]|uniref:PGRS family protein n=1 Tax=Sorangium sp. So ce1078 TaxID=3133329 RepID=UPI003F63ADCA
MRLRRVRALLVTMGCVIGASGCDGLWYHIHDDCELMLTCEHFRPTTSSGGPAEGCVPSENEGTVGDTCGVFVAASGNDGSAGTKAEPVKTLAEALRRAGEKGSNVYACAEPFAESVEVPAGVALFGGLDCANGWTWIGGQTKTTVAPEAEAIPLTLARGEGTTRLEDIEARAPDAKAKGGSSIAVLADGATAELARCALVAGNAADGDDGDDAPSETPERAPGGSNGVDACSELDDVEGPDATLPGGAQVVNECGGELSIGGRGGDGNQSNGGDGASGQTGLFGAAGVGEPAMNTWSCSGPEPNGTGDGGADGIPGTPGAGASGVGALSATGYTGVPGGGGTPGKPGQGGGGGGGAKGGPVCAGGVAGAGASGGSGGAGGCGGLPGQGGGPGGASIAIASVDASVTLTDCTLTAGRGGNGGKGGDLQPGGIGGSGGTGGTGVGLSKAACAGGQGGQGGPGGPGGGGLGGPSLAIAFRGTPVVQQGQTTLIPGAPGTGGPGGSNNITDNAGYDGVAAETQELP